MLTLGFSGAFRRCELVALMVPDVTFHADGLVVTVRRSKGDQESQGATVAIPYGAVEAACPVRAVRAWLACLQAAGITAGPVFRRVWAHGRIGRHALRGGAVAVIVKQQATAAGLDARTFSGHSLRAGLATSAAQAGKSPFAIRDQGRWAGVASIEGYIRQGQQFTDFNAAKGL
jgi:integrase